MALLYRFDTVQPDLTVAAILSDGNNTMQKTLIVFGVVIILAGILWPWLSKVPFGRLPGDIVIDKPNFKMFFPVTSMLLVSGLVSLIMWLLRK